MVLPHDIVGRAIYNLRVSMGSGSGYTLLKILLYTLILIVL